MRAPGLFLAIFVGLGLLVVVVGAGFYWWVVQTTPAYRLQLDDTTWRVTDIGGTRVPAAEARILSFRADAITVQTPCGTSTSPFAMDTDGAAMGFGTQERADSTCEAEARRWHDAFAAALETTDEWDVDGDNAIRLIGAQTTQLERAPSR